MQIMNHGMVKVSYKAVVYSYSHSAISKIKPRKSSWNII